MPKLIIVKELLAWQINGKMDLTVFTVIINVLLVLIKILAELVHMYPELTPLLVSVRMVITGQ